MQNLFINSFVGKIMARSDKNKAKLREELDGITTLNLILNSTNILEKLLWVTIAVLGTLFIYDIVFAQLTYCWLFTKKEAIEKYCSCQNTPLSPSFSRFTTT